MKNVEEYLEKIDKGEIKNDKGELTIDEGKDE